MLVNYFASFPGPGLGPQAPHLQEDGHAPAPHDIGEARPDPRRYPRARLAEEQVDEGVSLDEQEAWLQAYCTMRGLAAVYRVEGVSGGKAFSARPVWAEPLGAIAAGDVAHAVV